MVLWNQSYSLGLMFVDCQNFAGLRGYNFLWVTGLLHRNARQSIILLIVRGDGNSLVMYMYLTKSTNKESVVSTVFIQSVINEICNRQNSTMELKSIYNPRSNLCPNRFFFFFCRKVYIIEC